eukprot:tig00020556_g11058.t1
MPPQLQVCPARGSEAPVPRELDRERCDELEDAAKLKASVPSGDARADKKRPFLHLQLPSPVLPGGAVLDLAAFASFVDSCGGYVASRRRKEVWARAREAFLRPSAPVHAGQARAAPALDPATMRMLYEIYVLASGPGKRVRAEAGAALRRLEESDSEADIDEDDGFGCPSDDEAAPALPLSLPAAPEAAPAPASPLSSRSPSPALLTLRRPAAEAKGSPWAASLLRGGILAAVVRHAAAGQRVGALAALRLVAREWRAAVDAAPPALYAALAFDGLRVPDAPAPFLLRALRRAAAAACPEALYALALATGLGAAGAPRDAPAAVALAMRAAAAGHPRATHLAGRLAPLAAQ